MTGGGGAVTRLEQPRDCTPAACTAAWTRGPRLLRPRHSCHRRPRLLPMSVSGGDAAEDDRRRLACSRRWWLRNASTSSSWRRSWIRRTEAWAALVRATSWETSRSRSVRRGAVTRFSPPGPAPGSAGSCPGSAAGPREEGRSPGCPRCARAASGRGPVERMRRSEDRRPGVERRWRASRTSLRGRGEVWARMWPAGLQAGPRPPNHMRQSLATPTDVALLHAVTAAA